MTEITVAALQLAFSTDAHANIARVADMVREAAGKGAQVVLPPELFEGEYFCRVEDEGLFAAAKPTAAHPSVIAMQRSEEHTSELQSLMRSSYAVFCLKKQIYI